MMRFVALKKKTRPEPFSFYHGKIPQENSSLKSVRRPSPNTESAATFILDFLTSRTMKNKGLLFKAPSLQYFVIAT